MIQRLVPCASAALAIFALPQQAGAQCWSESPPLYAEHGSSAEYFGQSAAVSGDTAVVGAPGFNKDGQVYVFERDGSGTWVELLSVIAADAGGREFFGMSVALDGDTLVVGSPYDDEAAVANDAGAVYVFERDQGGAGAWGQVKKLWPNGAQGGDLFGTSVAVSGDHLAAGAPADQTPAGLEAGSAHVFDRNLGGAGNWGYRKKVVNNSQAAFDRLGTSVAMAGDLLLVGSPNRENPVINGGSVFVFQRDLGGNNQWSQLKRLEPSDPNDHANFGLSVALQGETALVGAYNHSFGEGRAYLFERNLAGPETWTETALLAPQFAYQDRFGSSVALYGDTAVVGAPGTDGGRGSTEVFGRDSGGPQAWGLEHSFLGISEDDELGTSVATTPDTVFSGASQSDGAAFFSGSVRHFEPGGPVNYCTPGTSASGCQAQISASGQASASAASGFFLSATSVEGAKVGMFIYGASGRQANSWGNGSSFQCAAPPRLRGGSLAPMGTEGACDGAFTMDLNARWCPTCPKPNHNYGQGAVVQAQLWYRDPEAGANIKTSLSDAVEFCVGP